MRYEREMEKLEALKAMRDDSKEKKTDIKAIVKVLQGIENELHELNINIVNKNGSTGV